MTSKLEVGAGHRFPMGASVVNGGVNFCVLSPRATRMWLRLYRGATDAEPLAEIELAPARHRTFAFWHVFVGGAQPGWFYTWRADGRSAVMGQTSAAFDDAWAMFAAPAFNDDPTHPFGTEGLDA